MKGYGWWCDVYKGDLTHAPTQPVYGMLGVIGF